jgi:TRAP-type C4-dicarboxylate transport system substrate-binding protein
MHTPKLVVFLAAASLVAACHAQKADAPAAPAAKPVVLAYANFPPAATFPCVQMEQWRTEVEKRTAGRVKVQTFPGGTLLGAKEIFDGVVAGTADIGCFAMSYQPGRFPVTEAVDLPHFFPSARVATEVLADVIEKYQPAEFAKVKVLTVFTCPPAGIMSSKPVNTLADLANMSLRSSGTGADAMKRLGATPVAMPQSETPDALQKGVVKGVVSSVEVLKDMNYAAYCPYLYPAALNTIGFAVVMNKAKYESLPAESKQVLDALFREHAQWTADYVDGHAAEAVVWAQKQPKPVTVATVTDADRVAMAKSFAPLFDAYVERVAKAGVPGKEILACVAERKAAHTAPAAVK